MQHVRFWVQPSYSQCVRECQSFDGVLTITSATRKFVFLIRSQIG